MRSLADLDWYQRTISELVNDSNRIHLLSELKIALSSLTSSHINVISKNVQLDLIFDCLNSSEREQVTLAADVLSVLISQLDPTDVLNQYEAALLRVLQHPNPKAVLLVLKELQKAVENGYNFSDTSGPKDLLLHVVNCVGHNDLGVAETAVSVLTKLGTTTAGLDILYSTPVLEQLNNVMGGNDVIRFRVYEMTSDVSASSEIGLQKSHECGLMPALISEVFEGNDMLLLLNALEFITKLAVTEHGLKYLERNGVIRILADKVTDTSNPLLSLVIPGLIKFFGNVAHSWPEETLSSYPNIVQALVESFDTSDLVLVGIIMETVGYIGSSNKGKITLNRLGDKMLSAMRILGNHIRTLPTEFKVRALNTLANLVQVKEAEYYSEASAVSKVWFENLAQDPMELVKSRCQQPIPELRLAALYVLQILAELQWGQEHLSQCPGLVEYLLDRSSESDKLCKDAKYDVVKTIVNSATSEAAFGRETMERFQEFIRQGPFYVETQTEVAFEGAS